MEQRLLALHPGFGSGVFCLKSPFGLDKINTGLYSCGHQSLLSTLTAVPPFDLHSNPMKLAEWTLLFSFGHCSQESLQIRGFWVMLIMMSSSKIAAALSSMGTGAVFSLLVNNRVPLYVPLQVCLQRGPIRLNKVLCKAH